MFCPLCQAEYREGILQCADCDVDLVESLATENVHEGPVQLVWGGNDHGLLDALTGGLREAGIPFHDRMTQLQNVLLPNLAPNYEIWVLESDLERAQQVIENLVGELPLSSEEGSGPEAPEELVEELSPEVLEDWNLEEITCEAWSGQDGAFGEFLLATFRENAIRCRRARDTNGSYQVLVHPEDAERAREIARQVVEGVSPEEGR